MSVKIPGSILNLKGVRFRRISHSNEDKLALIFVDHDRRFHHRCSQCGKVAIAERRGRRQVRDLPLVDKKTYLNFEQFKVNCSSCGIRIERLDFVDPYSRCTKRFEELVARLCKITDLKAVAELLELDWETVKNIDKKYLKAEFGKPDFSGLRLLAIDEISSRKGHRYFTIVLDLAKGRVVWVGKGRKEKTLDQFFTLLTEKQRLTIEAVAMDMWPAYINSVEKHCPQALIVFDKFHVIKEYSKVIDNVRNVEYRKAFGKDKEIIQGTKWLLLKNNDKLKEDEKQRLDELLALNKNIATTYILKDLLKRLWLQEHVHEANVFLNHWCQLAVESPIKGLISFAHMLKRHRMGLLNHCLYPINSAKLEGTNNKIKVIKRRAYGFHDDDYFILKIIQLCQGTTV